MYERGLSLFQWPANHTLWLSYLTHMITRYKEKKIERIRDLFERVLDECPEDKRSCRNYPGFVYYNMYVDYEEEFGLLNHAVEILDRMTDEIPDKDKVMGYELFVAKVATYLGITRTRPIYEKALENLQGKEFILFGIRFAGLERRLGEVDRAREIFNYLGPMVDPDMDTHQFWKKWEEFEMACGNEDTYKEMMRVRRTVETKFSILPPSLEKVKMKIEREADQKVREEEVVNKYQTDIEKVLEKKKEIE